MSDSAEYQPLSATPAPAPALAHLLAVSQAMRGMLAACLPVDSSPPEVEAVHQLRTGTRRVEATLETLAREAGARGLAAPIEQARQRWLRQLKKVRQASGAVRDLDVHRELLAEHFLPASEESLLAAEPEQAIVTQARALDAWLAVRRVTSSEALRYALDGRVRKLDQVEQQFVAAYSKRRAGLPRVARPAARLALEDYLRLIDAFPQLDAENLHDFRKGAKKARYVAEAGGDDASAVAMAKAIKRVQDAIGDWHDWEVLAAESHEALGEQGAELAAELHRRVKREYARALRMAASMGRRFIGEWQAIRPQARHRAIRTHVTVRQKF